jgi:hypothetical protein
MRKQLPYILGLASILWIIGGTIWYKNRFCDFVATPTQSLVNVSPIQVTTAQAVQFEALNLYYPKNRFQFKLTDDLSLYFNDLKTFLTTNSASKIHIYSHNTEGDRIEQKRLLFLKNTLKDKDFDLNQFEFHKTAFQPKPVNFQENELKNQRIEIRLAVP